EGGPGRHPGAAAGARSRPPRRPVRERDPHHARQPGHAGHPAPPGDGRGTGHRGLIRQYSLVIEPLLTVHDEIGRGVADDELASRSLALAALARAKESTARQRGLLTVILVSDQVDQKLLQG